MALELEGTPIKYHDSDSCTTLLECSNMANNARQVLFSIGIINGTSGPHIQCDYTAKRGATSDNNADDCPGYKSAQARCHDPSLTATLPPVYVCSDKTDIT